MLSGSNCVVAFTTLAGLSYDVQRIGEAGGGNWSLVSTGIAGNVLYPALVTEGVMLTITAAGGGVFLLGWLVQGKK